MFLSQLFLGRNGIDPLNKALAGIAVILWVISRFMTGGIRTLLFYLFLLAAGAVIFRAFSRNLERRRSENEWFGQWISKWRSGSEAWSYRKEQRAEYKVFKCPGCGTKMRVPRGEGKVRVTCRQCGAVFEKKV